MLDTSNVTTKLNIAKDYATSFEDKSLNTYLEFLDQKPVLVVLYNDFAEHSFGWGWWYTEDAFHDQSPADYVGGLIYHGSTEGERVDNFTVTVDNAVGWRLHS